MNKSTPWILGAVAVAYGLYQLRYIDGAAKPSFLHFIFSGEIFNLFGSGRPLSPQGPLA